MRQLLLCLALCLVTTSQAHGWVQTGISHGMYLSPWHSLALEDLPSTLTFEITTPNGSASLAIADFEYRSNTQQHSTRITAANAASHGVDWESFARLLPARGEATTRLVLDGIVSEERHDIYYRPIFELVRVDVTVSHFATVGKGGAVHRTVTASAGLYGEDGAIPEPTSLVLLAITAMIGLARRQRPHGGR